MAEENTPVTPSPETPVAPVTPELPADAVENSEMVTPEVAAAPVAPTPEGTITPPPEEAVAPEAAPEVAPERIVPKPSEYTIPEGMPDSMRIFAHENGFTQTQLDATLTNMGAYVEANTTAQRVALRDMGEAHLKNWGDQKETNLNLAKQALHQNDPDGQLAKALDDSGYGNHPAVLDFLHNLGKGMQEGGFLKRAVRRPPGQKTAAESMYGKNHSVSE
jgi:hypothetical protein